MRHDPRWDYEGFPDLDEDPADVPYYEDQDVDSWDLCFDLGHEEYESHFPNPEGYTRYCDRCGQTDLDW